MFKYFIGILLIIIISWVVFWREKVAFQENVINEWLSEKTKSNYILNYSLKSKGFPNRIDSEIDKLKILLPENGDELIINNTLLMSLIYNSDNVILSIKPPLKLSTDRILFELPSGSIIISKFKEHSSKKTSFVLHGKNLIMNLNGQNFLSINDLIIATRFTTQERYKDNKELFIKIDKLYFSELNKKRTDHLESINLTFDSSMDLIKKLGFQKIPLILNTLNPPNSIGKGTLKIINTNLYLEKDLSYLEPIIRKLLHFFKYII